MKSEYANLKRAGELTNSILNEGTLYYHPLTRSFSLDSQIKVGDKVVLDTKKDNTYDEYFLPFVRKQQNEDALCMGIVLSEPLWIDFPKVSEYKIEWAEIRDSQFFRMAIIRILHPIAVYDNHFSYVATKDEKPETDRIKENGEMMTMEERKMKTRRNPTGLEWCFLPPLLLDSDAIRKDIRRITTIGGVLFSNSMRKYIEC